MSWNDITEQDLVEGSEGVEGEEHYSQKCQPLMENGIYGKGSRAIGNITFYFRNCNCGKYNRAECKRVIQQFRTSSIPLPTHGVDIHRDSQCSYAIPRERLIWQGNKQRTVYIFPLHCVCKTRPRTSMVYR